MTHVSQTAGVRRVPTHGSIAARPQPSLLGNRASLRAAVAAKRAQISALETDWVTAAEADAGRQASKGVRMDDRATWDGVIWARYLAAAEAFEPAYKPKIKQLLREIDSLERLLDMPTGTNAVAS